MKKRFLLIGIFCCILLSCNHNNQVVPYARVNFSVNTTSTNLIHVGGYEYFTGGVSGIFVYRSDMLTFHAYDRACPYDWENGGRVEVDTNNNFILIDYKCGSKFNILDGYPLSGKAEEPLQEYNAQMIDDIYLRVYN
ncbi:MAG: hypothetical protein J5606_01260 [Bacteroidales bacterium]|nr:hypothetical protein [Bacteroidales bacterium]